MSSSHGLKAKHKSSNLQKYQSKNVFRRIAIWDYYRNLNKLIPENYSNSPIKVLDAGCGEGFTTKYFHQRYAKWSFTGIDVNKYALNYSIKQNSFKFPIVSGSIEKMPFKKREFELVFCLEVLEHLKSPVTALRELKRVTKYLILTTPNEPIFRTLRFFAGLNVSKLGLYPEHKQFWSYKSFKEFVSLELNIQDSFCPLPYAWSYFFCRS